MSEPTWLAKARTYVGLAEIPGPGTNTTIAGWLAKLKALSAVLRFGEGAFNRPAERVDASVHQIGLEPLHFSGLGYGHAAASPLNNPIGPFVSLLRLSLRPNAIRHRVGSGVLQPIERRADRTRPHIAIERLEAFAPFVADRNAASAVVLEIGPARIVAASAHVGPDAELGRFGHAVGGLCSLLRRPHRHTTNAPAIGRATRPQVTSDDAPLRAAFTTAKPTPSARINHSPLAIYFSVFHADDTTWKLATMQGIRT